MKKYIQYTMGIICMIFCTVMNISSVSAAQQVDCDVVTVYHTDYWGLKNYETDVADYLFTKKSSEKEIPLQIDTDGVMLYCFSSENIQLLNEKKQVIQGKTGDDLFNANYDTKVREKAVSVKRDQKYYVRIPKMGVDEKHGIYLKVFPRVKELEGEKDYISEGTGRYVYYSFGVRKKSLLALYADHLFRSHDKMYFKMQKKVKGKWEDVASVQSKVAYTSHLGEVLPYGLAKGRYRLGVKVKQGQSVCIRLKFCGAACRSVTKKGKALSLKRGHEREGVFTWNDKKSHWYKVVKMRKNKVSTLTVYAGNVIDKIYFHIYKKGVSKPIKILRMRGKKPLDEMIKYTSKSFTLKDNHTYYIKVSKANKKTNGAYKLRVK